MPRRNGRIAEIKRRVGIEEVIAHIGLHNTGKVHRAGEWLPIKCPFHDDKHASASINRATSYFRCHACAARGDVIDVAKLHLDTDSTTEAISWLERTF
jgi:DNA primase